MCTKVIEIYRHTVKRRSLATSIDVTKLSSTALKVSSKHKVINFFLGFIQLKIHLISLTQPFEPRKDVFENLFKSTVNFE